ncbi:hypothetical protein KAU08_00035 [bacterium]|nr:hypothetical protein [bacterium]
MPAETRGIKMREVKRSEKKTKDKSDGRIVPQQEQFELLISEKYELTKPVPVHVYRYDDGTVLIRSMELDLFAQGDREYDARLSFSEVLISELEDLEKDLKNGQKIGKALQLELSMLRRLLRKAE